jgi:hypothetical protein
MTTWPQRVRRSSLWLVLAVLLVAGCGRGQAAVPAGAQLVAVSATGSEVRLDPSTVRAGDVYVVLETPGSSVGFVQRMSTAAERPGPLTDEDLARLAHGDTQGTAIGSFDDTGCSPEQRAEDRGRMGPCGNVFKLVLGAGRYAFFAGNLDGAPPGDYSRSIAVLEVLP